MDALIDFLMLIALISIVVTPIVITILLCETSKWLNKIYDELFKNNN